MTESAPSAPSTAPSYLPADDALRRTLHNEVHARPQARIRMPALVLYVAVYNAEVSREQECAHLRLLPGQAELALEQMQGNFLRLRPEGYTLKWERHSEFTRYSLVQSLPAQALQGIGDAELLASLMLPPDWLRSIPGAHAGGRPADPVARGPGRCAGLPGTGPALVWRTNPDGIGDGAQPALPGRDRSGAAPQRL